MKQKSKRKTIEGLNRLAAEHSRATFDEWKRKHPYRYKKLKEEQRYNDEERDVIIENSVSIY